MTTTISTPIIQGLKSISYPPKRGERYLSIDLTKVDDVAKVFDVAAELGFKPELVQISTRAGVEIHALLLHEQTDGEPLLSNLDEQLDQLAEEINTEAIRHCYGGRFLAS